MGPGWILEFQGGNLARTQRLTISCPEIILAPELKVTKEEQTEIRNLNKIFSIEKAGKESKQQIDLPTPHETILEALKILFANFKITHLSGINLIIAPLKRKLIQEAPLPGPPIKQSITLTGPVQKTYLQNEDQTSQKFPISIMTFSRAEETKAERATAKETGASGEAQPVSGASVSGEAGEATCDTRSQSAPKSPMKKRYRKRNAPSDVRRKIIKAQEFQAKVAENTVFAAKFFNAW